MELFSKIWIGLMNQSYLRPCEPLGLLCHFRNLKTLNMFVTKKYI